MAKYLDSNGLAHLITLIKGAFSVKSHTHSIGTPTTGPAATVTAGTAASLSTETKTFVTSASKLTMGTAAPIKPITKKTVVTGGTKTAIPNISVESKSIPNVTNAGSAATASVSGHKATFTNGTAPTLGTAISVGSASEGTAIEAYTALTTGDSVTEGSAISVPQFTVADAATGTVKGVDTFTANTPTTVTSNTVVIAIPNATGSASA